MHGTVTLGNPGSSARRACLTETDRKGRGDGEDLEVGAVDELLVGECEDRETDKGEKLYVASPLFDFSLSPLYY